MTAYVPISPSYVEPVPVEEIVAYAPATVKVVDNAVYAVLYIPHVSPEELARGEERRVCVRLVMPRDGAAKLARALDDAIVASFMGREEAANVIGEPEFLTLLPQ